MSEPKWTPGPWESRHPEDGPAHVVQVYIDARNRRCTAFVCTCESATLPNDENARLIAAAPDLYAALAQIVDAETGDEDWTAARAALAKATARVALAKAGGEV